MSKNFSAMAIRLSVSRDIARSRRSSFRLSAAVIEFDDFILRILFPGMSSAHLKVTTYVRLLSVSTITIARNKCRAETTVPTCVGLHHAHQQQSRLGAGTRAGVTTERCIVDKKKNRHVDSPHCHWRMETRNKNEGKS